MCFCIDIIVFILQNIFLYSVSLNTQYPSSKIVTSSIMIMFMQYSTIQILFSRDLGILFIKKLIVLMIVFQWIYEIFYRHSILL